MTTDYCQVAWSNGKADELPKTGAIPDGAAVAERVAKEAMDTRTMVHAATRSAATFHEGVEELVDMEEVRVFGFEEGEGRKHRMVRAVGR